VPKVEIVDEHGATAGDKFYKAGSTIELKCVVSNIPQPTGYVTWRHGSRTLNYDTIRGGIRWVGDALFYRREIFDIAIADDMLIDNHREERERERERGKFQF